MSRTLPWTRLGAVVSLALAACAGTVPDPLVETPTAAAERPTIEAPGVDRTAHEAPGRPVLDEPNLDPEIVALARASLACDWGRFGFHGECEAMKAYLAAGPIFKTAVGRETLLRMLEDRSERVRYLAARKLWGVDEPSAESAARIIAAAERETSPVVARDLGAIAGGIDVARTGSLEPIAELARKHDLYELRVGLLSRLMQKNAGSLAALELVGELVSSPNSDVAFQAVASLHHVDASLRERACAMLLEPLRSGRDRIVAPAAREASKLGCAALRGEVLEAANTHLDRKNPDGSLVTTLEPMCTSPDTQPDLKRRAASLAERALKNEKLFWGYRVDAIKAILACEPRTGAAVVKGYRDDANDNVRQMAITRTNAP